MGSYICVEQRSPKGTTPTPTPSTDKAGNYENDPPSLEVVLASGSFEAEIVGEVFYSAKINTGYLPHRVILIIAGKMVYVLLFVAMDFF